MSADRSERAFDHLSDLLGPKDRLIVPLNGMLPMTEAYELFADLGSQEHADYICPYDATLNVRHWRDIVSARLFPFMDRSARGTKIRHPGLAYENPDGQIISIIPRHTACGGYEIRSPRDDINPQLHLIDRTGRTLGELADEGAVVSRLLFDGISGILEQKK